MSKRPNSTRDLTPTKHRNATAIVSALVTLGYKVIATKPGHTRMRPAATRGHLSSSYPANWDWILCWQGFSCPEHTKHQGEADGCQ